MPCGCPWGCLLLSPCQSGLPMPEQLEKELAAETLGKKSGGKFLVFARNYGPAENTGGLISPALLALPFRQEDSSTVSAGVERGASGELAGGKDRVRANGGLGSGAQPASHRGLQGPATCSLTRLRRASESGLSDHEPCDKKQRRWVPGCSPTEAPGGSWGGKASARRDPEGATCGSPLQTPAQLCSRI